ncbi:MAG TPA: hypothetical protein VK700_16450 [Steroidobacteraceae bacterium]|jgi:hypothetical protein|nr:hypothetical protein [Steroidobacteraceae bacterium]
MSAYIDATGRLIYEQERNLVLQCPHCDVTSHIAISAVPDFAQLQQYKPRAVGIVARCDACHAPIFLRFPVRMYRSNRIELSAQFTEIERPREKFTFTHLPAQIEQPFREALLCFSGGAYNAFASMCRRTARAAFADLGESGKLRVFDQLNEVRALVNIDTETFQLLKAVIFGTGSDSNPEPPALDANSAAVVLEVMKDLLYEAYVRRGRLQQALLMRKFLADETAETLMPLRDASQQPA